jgi:hypothetical protein
MPFGKVDELAINTIRTLAVRQRCPPARLAPPSQTATPLLLLLPPQTFPP